MKKFTIIAIALCLVSTTALAQSKVVNGQNRGGAIGNNGNKNITLRALRMAVEEIQKGSKILRDCLPIYDGHRAAAIRYAELARSEIRVGIMEQRLESRSSTESIADKDNKNKYTQEQIDTSNVKLVIGARYYENALSILQKTNWEQVNRKSNAIKALQSAIKELQLALAPYGGPGQYQRAAGNRGRINP